MRNLKALLEKKKKNVLGLKSKNHSHTKELEIKWVKKSVEWNDLWALVHMGAALIASAKKPKLEPQENLTTEISYQLSTRVESLWLLLSAPQKMVLVPLWNVF